MYSHRPLSLVTERGSGSGTIISLKAQELSLEVRDSAREESLQSRIKQLEGDSAAHGFSRQHDLNFFISLLATVIPSLNEVAVRFTELGALGRQCHALPCPRIRPADHTSGLAVLATADGKSVGIPLPPNSEDRSSPAG